MNGFDEEDDLNIAQDTSADILNKGREASSDALANSSFVDGDGEPSVFPSGETNEWGGNLRNEGRKVMLRRDKNGKVSGYSTTTSMITKDDDGSFVVIPTVVDGRELSSEDAVSHYRKTGEYWGKANDEDSAREIARKVHERHQSGYQRKWNDYIHSHWDDMSDDIRNDAGIAEEHARRVGGNSDMSNVAQNQPTFTRDEMLDRFANGGGYTEEEVDSMTDDQYNDFIKTSEEYFSAHPTMEMRRAKAQKNKERWDYADNLAKMADYVVQQTEDDPDFANDYSEAKKYSEMLKQYGRNFGNLSAEDQIAFAENIGKMYEDAKNRRGFVEKMADSFARGHESFAAFIYRGAKLLQPNELDESDMQTLEGSRRTQELADIMHPKQSGSYKDNKDIGDWIDYIAENAAENVERIAVGAAASTAGAILAPYLGVSAGVGAIAGGTAGTLLLNGGEAVSDQLDEAASDKNINFSRGHALAQTGWYSILDGALGVDKFFGNVFSKAVRALGKGVVKEGAAKALAETAKNSTLGGFLKSYGRNILEEAIQEPAQSQIGGRGRRYLQTGSALTADELEAKRSGRDSNPVLTATIDEGLGGAGAAAILGFFGGAANSINANRVVKLYDNMLKELKKETNYNSFSTEERLLITQRLANDALLETSGIFKEGAKEKIQKMSDEINSALSSQGRAYVDMFKQQFSALPMDEALAAASAAGIKTRFNADSMNGQREELSIGVDGGETKTLTSPETGIRVSRHVNAEGKVSYAVENVPNMKSPFANCVFDTGDEKTDFENAVKYASELDVYNQYRAKQQEDKRKAIDRVYRNMYGERSPELVFVDRPNVAERKLLPVGHKAAYVLNGNRVLVDADAVDTLGSLYTLLGHERSHADIAEGFAKESFAPGGPTAEQIGKVEEGRQKYFGKDKAGKEQIKGSEKTTNLNRQVSAFEVNDIYNKAVDANGNFSLGKFRMEFEKLFDLDGVSDKNLRKFADMLGSGKNDAQSIRDGLTALYINNEKRRKMIGTESGSPDVVRKGNDWGGDIVRTGEEMVVERMSINDLYNALSSSSRGLLSEGAARLAKAIGIKMAFDMGVDPSLITSADVQKELGHILRSGYAGKTSKYERPGAITSNEDAAPEEAANKAVESEDAPAATPVAPAETTAVETAPVAPKGGTYLEPMVDGEGEDIPVGTVIQRKDGRMFTKANNGWITDFEDKKVTTTDSDATADGWRYVTQGKAIPASTETKINKNSAQVDKKAPEKAEAVPQNASKATEKTATEKAEEKPVEKKPEAGNFKQQHTAEVTKEASGGREVARFVDKDGVLHVKNEQDVGGKPRVTETLIDKEGNIVPKPAENAPQSAPSEKGVTSQAKPTEASKAAPVASEAKVAEKPAPKTEKDSLFDSMVESAESKTPAKKGETKYDKARKIPGLPRNAKGKRLYPADPAELLNQYEELLNHPDHTASTLREAIDTVNSDWGKKVTYKKVTDEHNARLAKIIEAANDRVSKLEDQQREERGQRNADRAHNRQSVMSVEEERDMLKWYRDYMANNAAWINAFIQGNRWNGLMAEPPVTYRFKPGTYYAYPVWGYRTSDDGTVREHDLEDKYPAREFFEVEYWDRNYKGHKKGDVKGIKFRDGADLNAYHMLFGKTTRESTATEPIRDQSKVDLSFHGAFGEDKLADSGIEFDDRANGSDISYEEIFDQLVDQYYEMRDLWGKHQRGEGEAAMVAEMEAAREAERAANPETEYNDQRIAEDDEAMKALYGDEEFGTMADDILLTAYEIFGDPDIMNKSEGEMIAGGVRNDIPEVYKTYSDTKLMRMAYDHDPNAFGLLYDRFMVNTKENGGGLPHKFAILGVPEGRIDDLCGKVWDRFLSNSMYRKSDSAYHKYNANTMILGMADFVYKDYKRLENGLANRKGGETLNLDEAVEDDSGDKMNRMDAISQEAVDEINALNGHVNRYNEYRAAVDKVANILEYLSDGRAKMLRALLAADSGIGEEAETVADTEHTDDFGNLESLKKLNSREKRYSTRTLAKAASLAGMPPYLYIHELGDLFKEIKAAHTGKDRQGKRIALMVEPEVEAAYTNNELSDFMEDDRKGMWAFMTRLADERLDNATIAKRWNDTLKDTGDSVGANTVRGVLSKAKLLYGWMDPRPSEGSKYQQQLSLDTEGQTSSREISDFAKMKLRTGLSEKKVTDIVRGRFGLGKLEAANEVSKAKSAISRKTKSGVSQGDLFAAAGIAEEKAEAAKKVPFRELTNFIRDRIEKAEDGFVEIVNAVKDKYGVTDSLATERVERELRKANARMEKERAKKEGLRNTRMTETPVVTPSTVKYGKAEQVEEVKQKTFDDMVADVREMMFEGISEQDIVSTVMNDYGETEAIAKMVVARVRGESEDAAKVVRGGEKIGDGVKYHFFSEEFTARDELVSRLGEGEVERLDKVWKDEQARKSAMRKVGALMSFWNMDATKLSSLLAKRGLSEEKIAKTVNNKDFVQLVNAADGLGLTKEEIAKTIDNGNSEKVVSELMGQGFTEIEAREMVASFLSDVGNSEEEQKIVSNFSAKALSGSRKDKSVIAEMMERHGAADAESYTSKSATKRKRGSRESVLAMTQKDLFGDFFSFKSEDAAGGNEDIRYKTADEVLAMSDDEKRKNGILPSPSGMRRYVLDVHGKWGVWRGIIVPETEEGRKELDRDKAGRIGIWAKSLRDAIHIAKTNYIYDNSPFAYRRAKGNFTIEEKKAYNDISWRPVWIHGYTSDRPGGMAYWYPGKTEAKAQHKDYAAIIDEIERKIDAVQKREFENARRKNQGSAGENDSSGGAGGRSGLGYGARGGRGVGASVSGVGGGVRPNIGARSGAAVIPSGEAGRVAKAGTAVQRDLFDPFYDRSVSLKTIIGENGAIDDKNLPIAKQMLGGRKWHTLSHDEKRRIVDATGWQLNAKDGKWRKVGPGFDLEKTNRLGEVFDAVEDLRNKQKATGRKVDEFALNQRITEEFRKAIPEELLKMYPKLRELKFRIVDSIPHKGSNSVAAGGFDNRRFMILFDKRFSPNGKEKNPQELFRVIFEHEVQHAIQNIEGFFGASRFAKPDNAVGLEMEREAHNTPYAEDGELLEDTEMSSDTITSSGYPKPEREMDIRYKSSDDIVTSAEDQAYLDAVKSGDTEAALRMIRKAAKKAMPNTKVVDEDGLPLVVYHGTNNPFNRFSEVNRGKNDYGWFGRGFYFFAPVNGDVDTAMSAAKDYGKRVVPAFVNIVNPNRTNAADTFTPDMVKADRYSADAKSKGHDGTIAEHGDVDEIVAFNPTQIKSADIAYDDDGNVIPLSHRFNPDMEDIRYKTSGLYTGSAADYDVPSLLKVGTGEGSQVYGWGLYASNQRGVAEDYAEWAKTDPLSRYTMIFRNGEKVRAVDSPTTLKETAEEYLQRLHISDIRWIKDTIKRGDRGFEAEVGNNVLLHFYGKEWENIFYNKMPEKMRQQVYRSSVMLARYVKDHINDYTYKEIPSTGRNIYEQTFFTNRAPGDESHLLNWYEPVSEENARRAIDAVKSLGLDQRDLDATFGGDWENKLREATGQKVYQMVTDAFANLDVDNAEKSASELLAKFDIDGIKYPVDSYGKDVKNGDEAGWNYVSFRDDNITVDHKWVDGTQMFKTSDPAYIAADSADAVFANRESQESKGLYWGKDIVRPSVKDRELERIAQEANDVPGAKDAVVEKALGGEGLNEREMRQLVLIERDALNRLNGVATGMNTDNAKSRSEEYDLAQKGLDRISLAVQRAISHAGATLREAQKAAWFDTTRDQLAYLERHVRATMAKQGVSGEIPEAVKKMLDTQAKALADANREVAKAQAELAKANEEAKMLSRDLEIERARGGKPFRMSGDAREKLASLSKKYGFSVTANTMNAIGALARLGGVSNIRTAGPGEGTVISLTDEMRECFGQILADADGDFDKALGLIHGTMDNRFDSAFAQYRAEMEKTPSPDGTKSGKRKVIREKAKKQSENFAQKNHPALDIGRIAPSGKNLDAMKRKVERERAEAIEMLGDFFANDEMKREVVGNYLRDFMRYYALENPSKTNDEVLQAMLDEANAIDPEHEYRHAEMADVLLGDNGYISRTRERVSTRMANLQKALSLAKSGDLKGAAKAAGISYRSDTDLILELDHKLRGKINRALDSLDRAMADSASGAGEDAANALRENINEMVNALRDIHSGGDVGEMLDKYLHLVESMRNARRESTILDTINRHIAELNRRLAENDFEPKAKRVKPNVESYSKVVRRKMEERDKLRKRFEAARASYEYRKRSSVARLTSDIFEILGEVKSIAGALDFSSVLRQGGQLTWAHPLLFAKNFRKMLSVFLNEDKAQAAMDEIRSRPNAKYYEAAGVDFTDWGRDAVNKDDRFLLNQYRRITGWKPLRVSVEASERAFSMYLNLMRADVFDHLVAASTYGDASKMSQKTLEAIGDFINIGSQRGAFHSHSEFEKAVKSSVPFLNSFLWSPRNVISRFQFLWQTAKLAMPWANPYGDKALRGLFAKELLRYFGGVAVAITFSKFISDLIRGDDEPPEDLVLDPRSSEFLKVKFGKTRVDFLSGLAQSIVFSARMAPKWIGGGMTVNARGEARPTDHTAVLGRFMRSKFSPAMGIIWDMGTGSTFDKQEIIYSNPFAYNKDEAGIVSYIAGQIFPLTLSDLWEQASQSGLSNAAITSIGTILGLGTNTYDYNTYNNLSADYRFYKKLYTNAESQDEKDRLLKYYPMLKMAGSIEAQIKRVNKIKSDIKKLQKAGGDTSVLDDMLEREKKIAINMIMGFNHPGQTD